ncbi:hypothetical protein ABFX02_01G113600 [Erythranthe guttata]
MDDIIFLLFDVSISLLVYASNYLHRLIKLFSLKLAFHMSNIIETFLDRHTIWIIIALYEWVSTRNLSPLLLRSFAGIQHRLPQTQLHHLLDQKISSQSHISLPTRPVEICSDGPQHPFDEFGFTYLKTTPDIPEHSKVILSFFAVGSTISSLQRTRRCRGCYAEMAAHFLDRPWHLNNYEEKLPRLQSIDRRN